MDFLYYLFNLILQFIEEIYYKSREDIVYKILLFKQKIAPLKKTNALDDYI